MRGNFAWLVGREYKSIGLALHANGTPGRRMLVDDRRNRVKASLGYSNFVNSRDRTMELRLEPSDRPYVLLPAMFEPGPACGGSAGWCVYLPASWRRRHTSPHLLELSTASHTPLLDHIDPNDLAEDILYADSHCNCTWLA